VGCVGRLSSQPTAGPLPPGGGHAARRGSPRAV